MRWVVTEEKRGREFDIIVEFIDVSEKRGWVCGENAEKYRRRWRRRRRRRRREHEEDELERSAASAAATTR